MKSKPFSSGLNRAFFYVSLSIAIILVTGASALLMQVLLNLEGWHLRPPAWDQAVHSLDAIHFAKSFKEWDFKEFFLQIHHSSLWPPVIPLLQSFYLLLTDFSIGSVRNTIAFSSLLAALAIFFSGWTLDKTWGLAVGLLASALLLVSPEFQEFCLQVMFEVPGIALTLIPFFCYSRYLDERKATYWQQTVLAATVVFFAKFNYAIMIFFPIICNELLRNNEFRGPLIDTISYFVRKIRWLHPFSIFVYLYLCFLLYIHFVGVRFEIGGNIVTIQRALGNPSYFLLFIIMLRMLIFYPSELKLYLTRIWSAPGPWKPVVRYFLLPVMIWLSYPPFFKTFFIFLFSESTRKQSFFSLETLSFYPGAFVNHYSPNYAVATACLVGIVIAIFSWKRLSEKLKLLVGIVIFNGLLVLSHPNYQERYLLTAVPFIFLLSAFGLILPVKALFKKQESLARISAALGGILVFTAVVGLIGFDQQALQKRFIKETLSPSFHTLSEKICEHVHESSNNAIIGLSGFLNPAAIAMTCYKNYPKIKRYQMPTTMTRLGFHGYLDGARVVKSGKIAQFFVADYSQMNFSIGRQQEAYLLPGAKAELSSSKLYREVDSILDQDSGLILTVYRRQPSISPISRRP